MLTLAIYWEYWPCTGHRAPLQKVDVLRGFQNFVLNVWLGTTWQLATYKVKVAVHLANPASRGRATAASSAQDKPTRHTSIHYRPELFARGQQKSKYFGQYRTRPVTGEEISCEIPDVVQESGCLMPRPKKVRV